MTDNDKLMERVQGTLSRQPRFHEDRQGFFSSITSFVRKLSELELKLPAYHPSSMRRDQELQKLWKLEPHWAGIINQTVLVDGSRGWLLVGGRNQVLQYSRIFHDAEEGKGWRHFMRKSSLSYRVTDLGNVAEIGREGVNGPLRALYHLDSARCRWTGDNDKPLAYYPVGDSVQYWPQKDFFNVVSLPSDNEKFRDLGFCQTSRAFEIIKILYGVVMHDQEMIGSRMPLGLLLLDNIDDDQWQDALESREVDRTAKERQYFGGVLILANEGTEAADVRLIALSQLPEHFDRETFIDQCMAAYALVSGYNLAEFWPVKSGALGRGKETEISTKQSATKGVLEFPHGFQEQLQNELPSSLLFQFEERDDEGELLSAQVAQAWTDVAKSLTAADRVTFESLLSTQQGQSYLVEHNVLDPEITEFEEEGQIDDVDRLRRRYLNYPHVRRAALAFPAEPIIEYKWSVVGGGRTRVLWDSGYELLEPRVWRVPQLKGIREGKEIIPFSESDERIGPHFEGSTTTAMIEGMEWNAAEIEAFKDTLPEITAEEARDGRKWKYYAGAYPPLPRTCKYAVLRGVFGRDLVYRQTEEVILFEDEETGVKITQADVERAIEQGGKRVGPEFEELLTAETVE